jgi:hypothetical protein
MGFVRHALSRSAVTVLFRGTYPGYHAMNTHTPSYIDTRLRRFFEAVARRRGTLTSQKALAEAMEMTGATVAHLFGHARDAEPLKQPAHRLGQLVRVFREAGIPIEEHWLTVSLAEFDRLLREATLI